MEMDQDKKRSFIAFAEKYAFPSVKKPERFIRKMEENNGYADHSNTDEDGSWRRNPLVVAFGDSVTGGHFEFLKPRPFLEQYFREHRNFPLPADVVDTQAVYHTQWKDMLTDRYTYSSVSVINAGIAGDTIIGMRKRLDRDVIRYQPDLVLLNGSLNWNSDIGTLEQYKSCLRETVVKIKDNTEADIILMTPNMQAENYFTPEYEDTLPYRVDCIREIAAEQDVCLADTYQIWEDFISAGNTLPDMLANGINHPTKAGHTVYAIALMKLID